MACATTDTDTYATAQPSLLSASGPVERYINFYDMGRCVPSDRMYAFLAGLIPLNADDTLIRPYAPTIPAALRRQVGTPVIHIADEEAATVRLPINRQWHGLRLTELRYWYQPQRDNSGFALTFDDDMARVRATLDALGFRTPPPGETRRIGFELPVRMQLMHSGEQTVFSCGY